MEDSISTYSSPSNKLESWKKTITRESLHISLRERERGFVGWKSIIVGFIIFFMICLTAFVCQLL